MTRAAFLVDGHLEQTFIKNNYPGRPVRRINCNGRNVELSTMAKYIATQCRLFDNKHYPIIILIDREDREQLPEEIGKTLHEKLLEEGIEDTIIIGVADRMIENWILADKEIVNKYKDNKKKIRECCEGQNGKNIIRKCIQHYHETTIGVELLETCRASIIIKNSPSFKQFYSQLPRSNFFWLQR